MCAMHIPTKGKHILKPPVEYTTQLKRKCWDLVGASHYADLENVTNSVHSHFQPLIIRCANKIPLHKQVHMEELRAFNTFKSKHCWDLVGAPR